MDFGQEYRAKSADTLCGLSLVSTSSDQVLAAAGGKNIRLHSPSTLSCLSTIGLQDTVRSIAASSADPNILWSASDDGVVRGWDVRYPKKEAMKKFSPTSRTGQLSSVACCGETGRVAAGTEAIKVEGEDAASVLLWDVRGGGAVMEYDEAHSDTITNLCFSPSDKKYLCSGSLDGLVCIIDTSVADPDDALESVLNAESSVSQAGFFGPASEYAYCLTLTETVLFWHIDEAQQLGHHGDVRQTLKENSNITVNYLVDCFYQASSTQLTATAGNHSGELFLLNVNLDGVHLIKSLPKRHQTTVCCMSYDHAVSPHHGWLKSPASHVYWHYKYVIVIVE
eukprot:scpid79961/ scgid24168/ WD repeat-containing protein 89 homolog